MARPTGDTPTKPHQTVGTFHQTMAADVEKSVIDELYKTLFTVDTDVFLDKIIPVASECVDKILVELKKAKLYDFSTPNRWENFPRSQNAKEKEFYTAFELLANKIRKLVESNNCAKDGAMKGQWVDCHHKPPESTDVRAAAIRPDGALISNEIDVDELKRHNLRLEELDRELRGQRSTNTTTSPEVEKKQEEENKLCRLWWLQMANIVEFKAKGRAEDVKQALIQLSGYARQLLREQLDRRFVIGLTICFDKLNLYLFDRSGVVATSRSINIHTEPEKFIQAVACFSVLPTEALGWDPTITMFYSGNCRSYASYMFPWTQLGGFSSPYTIQWVVDNPEDPSQKFISIRSLSLIGAEMMCGRTTIVLEVVRYDDYVKSNDQAQVFVMKQSWQRLPGKRNDSTGQVVALENSSLQMSNIPAGLPFDGESQDSPFDDTPYEVYVHSEAGLKHRIHCSGYIKSHGKVVDTLVTIRKGLTGSPGSMDTLIGSGASTVPSKRGAVDPSAHEDFIHHQTIPRREGAEDEVDTAYTFFATRHPRLASRRQTRIFMMMRGWPLKYFRNLKELLNIIYNAVEDHRRFFLKGILHRDVSGGNILILISSGEPRGFLLDLDHGKITRKFLSWKKTEQLHPKMSELVQTMVNADRSTVEIAATALGVKNPGRLADYIQNVAESRGLQDTNKRTISPDQLGWDNKASA
ncbi:hypothetical protein M422DRAFT_241778 [Sphaerobolus stellatus SS14]|nr:hypothetical protein M422DRAFT_241778 [Sphaerobolus stellatus SS14]